TTTYTPYFLLAGDSFDPTADHTFTGTQYQEVQTNFPLGNQLLTGLFLTMDVITPSGVTQTYRRTLADRIGIAARAGAGGSISVDPNGSPLVSALDLATLSINAAKYSIAALAAQSPVLNTLQQDILDFRNLLLTTPQGAALDT